MADPLPGDVLSSFGSNLHDALPIGDGFVGLSTEVYVDVEGGFDEVYPATPILSFYNADGILEKEERPLDPFIARSLGIGDSFELVSIGDTVLMQDEFGFEQWLIGSDGAVTWGNHSYPVDDPDIDRAIDLADGGYIVNGRDGSFRRYRADLSFDEEFMPPEWVDRYHAELPSGNFEVFISHPDVPNGPGLYEVTPDWDYVEGTFRPDEETDYAFAEDGPVIDSEGRTYQVVAGARNGESRVVRFLPDGSRDYSFQTRAFLPPSLPSMPYEWQPRLSITAAGDLLLVSGSVFRLYAGEAAPSEPAPPEIIGEQPTNVSITPRSYWGSSPRVALGYEMLTTQDSTVQWFVDGDPIPGATEPWLGQALDVSDEGTRTYTLRVTNSLGSVERHHTISLFDTVFFRRTGSAQDQTVLSFPTVEGRSYQVYVAEALEGWQPYGNPIAGGGNFSTVSGLPLDGSGQYRIAVER